MLAENRRNNYSISNITVGNLLEWENYCVLPSEISQIWVGLLPKELFPMKTYIILLFLTLSAQHIINFIAMLSLLTLGAVLWVYKHSQEGLAQVHVKLNNGDILSFSANEADTLHTFYYALKEAVRGKSTSETIFGTDGKVVETSEQKVLRKMSPILDMDISDFKNEGLLDELRKLYEGYEAKTETNSEILELINDTAALMARDDRDRLQDCFQKFVTLGLVGDCNELGLSSLIEEITSSLY